MENAVDPYAFINDEVLSDGTPADKTKGSNGLSSWTPDGDKTKQVDSANALADELRATGKFSEEEIRQALGNS